MGLPSQSCARTAPALPAAHGLQRCLCTRPAAASRLPCLQYPFSGEHGEDAWLAHNLFWEKRNGFYLEVVSSLAVLGRAAGAGCPANPAGCPLMGEVAVLNALRLQPN